MKLFSNESHEEIVRQAKRIEDLERQVESLKNDHALFVNQTARYRKQVYELDDLIGYLIASAGEIRVERALLQSRLSLAWVEHEDDARDERVFRPRRCENAI